MASKPEERSGSQSQDDGLTNQIEEAVSEEEGEEEGEEEDEEDEPKLKYARLTGSLGGVYRNGDATSAFLVGGDKMVWLLDDNTGTEALSEG